VLLVLIALLVAEPDPPADDVPAKDVPANNDIVVIGERMKKIRVATQADAHGSRTCIVRSSSGDPALDQAFCTAVLTCAQTETNMKGMNACMGRELELVRTRFTTPEKPPER